MAASHRLFQPYLFTSISDHNWDRSGLRQGAPLCFTSLVTRLHRYYAKPADSGKFRGPRPLEKANFLSTRKTFFDTRPTRQSVTPLETRQPASLPKRDHKEPKEAQPLASMLAQEAADLRLLYVLQLLEHGLHA